MFAEFIKRLTQPDPAQLPDGDARLALTALLVRIAKSDNEYAPSERARIDQIIAKRYALDADGTASLRADAEALEAEAPDTVRFTRAIKDAVPYDDRLAVIKALWEVVLAAALTRKTHCCVWWPTCWGSQTPTAPSCASRLKTKTSLRAGGEFTRGQPLNYWAKPKFWIANPP